MNTDLFPHGSLLPSEVPDPLVSHYRPRTELGRRLLALRRAYLEGGGRLLSWEEIDREVRERRGGVADD